jgi:hypothetical protein
MEEREQTRCLTFRDGEDSGYNTAVREFNQRIQSIKQSLKKEGE